MLLVLVPGLIGSTFFIVLDQLWISSSKLMAEEQDRSESVACLNSSFAALLAYCADLMNCCFKNDPNSKALSEQDLKEANKSFEKLKTLSSADPEFKPVVEGLERSARSVLAEAEKLAPSLENAGFRDNYARFLSVSVLVKKGLLYAGKAQLVVEDQNAIINTTRKNQQQQWALLRSLSYLGLLGSSLIAVVLLVAFNRKISKRLKTLVRHAQALSARKRPESLLKGNDELAYLDSVFDHSAQELIAEAEQRQSVIQMVAHDMRSPIMSSQIYVATFEELLPPQQPKQIQKWLKTCDVSLSRVMDFVNDLLTIEKLDSGNLPFKPEPYVLRDGVEQCIAQISSLATRKSITINNLCDKVEVTWDRQRIQQVICNFVSNALKFSPEGSAIDILSQTESGKVKVIVRDRGRGIDEEARKKVFEKFYQTERSDQSMGFGLGLAICKTLIDSHSGQVGVDSELGKGSDFWFEAPLHPSEKQATKQSIEEPQIKTRSLWDRIANPQLFEKGLFLVLFPIIVQAAWFVWLDGQMKTTEALLSRINRQSNVVTHLSILETNLFKLGSSVAFYVAGRKEVFKNLAEKSTLRCLEESEALKPHFIKSKHLVLWNELRELISKSQEYQKDVYSHGGERASQSDLGLIPVLMGDYQDLNGKIQKMFQQESKRLERLRREQARYIAKVQIVITLGIAAGFLMSLGLLSIFTLDITERLLALVDDARNLLARHNNESSLTGNDEFHFLSTVLRKTADELQLAEDKRKSLMSMIAHDMRSPLMAADGAIMLLNEASVEKLPSMAKESLEAASTNIMRVLRLLSDLLTLDKMKSGKMELNLQPVLMSDLLKDASAMVAGLAKEKSISIECEGGEFSLTADKDRLIQVLGNLLTNAIKFSPSSSLIKVIANQNSEGETEVAVIDQGQGMDAAASAKVFEKFFQVEGQSAAGFGLGLAICHSIILSHGGNIGVESEPGKGSKFWFRLPKTSHA